MEWHDPGGTRAATAHGVVQLPWPQSVPKGSQHAPADELVYQYAGFFIRKVTGNGACFAISSFAAAHLRPGCESADAMWLLETPAAARESKCINLPAGCVREWCAKILDQLKSAIHEAPARHIPAMMEHAAEITAHTESMGSTGDPTQTSHWIGKRMHIAAATAAMANDYGSAVRVVVVSRPPNRKNPGEPVLHADVYDSRWCLSSTDKDVEAALYTPWKMRCVPGEENGWSRIEGGVGDTHGELPPGQPGDVFVQYVNGNHFNALVHDAKSRVTGHTNRTGPREPVVDEAIASSTRCDEPAAEESSTTKMTAGNMPARTSRKHRDDELGKKRNAKRMKKLAKVAGTEDHHAEPEPISDSEPDPGANTQPDSKPDHEPDPGANTVTYNEPDPISEPEPDPVANTVTCTEPDPIFDSEPDSVANTVTYTGPDHAADDCAADHDAIELAVADQLADNMPRTVTVVADGVLTRTRPAAAMVSEYIAKIQEVVTSGDWQAAPTTNAVPNQKTNPPAPDSGMGPLRERVCNVTEMQRLGTRTFNMQSDYTSSCWPSGGHGRDRSPLQRSEPNMKVLEEGTLGDAQFTSAKVDALLAMLMDEPKAEPAVCAANSVTTVTTAGARSQNKRGRRSKKNGEQVGSMMADRLDQDDAATVVAASKGHDQIVERLMRAESPPAGARRDNTNSNSHLPLNGEEPETAPTAGARTQHSRGRRTRQNSKWAGETHERMANAVESMMADHSDQVAAATVVTASKGHDQIVDRLAKVEPPPTGARRGETSTTTHLQFDEEEPNMELDEPQQLFETDNGSAGDNPMHAQSTDSHDHHEPHHEPDPAKRQRNVPIVEVIAACSVSDDAATTGNSMVNDDAVATVSIPNDDTEATNNTVEAGAGGNPPARQKPNKRSQGARARARAKRAAGGANSSSHKQTDDGAAGDHDTEAQEERAGSVQCELVDVSTNKTKQRRKDGEAVRGASEGTMGRIPKTVSLAQEYAESYHTDLAELEWPPAAEIMGRPYPGYHCDQPGKSAKKSKSTLSVMTWNCNRVKVTAGAKCEGFQWLAQAFNQRKVDIGMLQEVGARHTQVSRDRYKAELGKAGFWSWVSTGPAKQDREGANWYPSIAFIMPKALADRLVTVLGSPEEVVPGRVGVWAVECDGSSPVDIYNVYSTSAPYVTQATGDNNSNNAEAAELWDKIEERVHHQCAKGGEVVLAGDLNVSLTPRDKGGRKWTFPQNSINITGKINNLLLADTHLAAHPLTAQHTHHAANRRTPDATLDYVLTSDNRPLVVLGSSIDRFPIESGMSDHAAKFVALDLDAIAGLTLPGVGRGIEVRRLKNKGVGVKNELDAFRAAFKRQKVGDSLGPSKFDDEFEKATTTSGGTRASMNVDDPPEADRVEGLLSDLVATLNKLGGEAGLVTTVKAKSSDRGTRQATEPTVPETLLRAVQTAKSQLDMRGKLLYNSRGEEESFDREWTVYQQTRNDMAALVTKSWESAKRTSDKLPESDCCRLSERTRDHEGWGAAAVGLTVTGRAKPTRKGKPRPRLVSPMTKKVEEALRSHGDTVRVIDGLLTAVDREVKRVNQEVRARERERNYREHSSRFFQAMSAVKADEPSGDFYHAATVCTGDDGMERVSFDPNRVKANIEGVWSEIYKGDNDPDLESSEYRDHMAKVQLTEKAMAHAKKLLVPWSTEDLAEGLRQANSTARIGKDNSSCFLLQHAIESDARVGEVTLAAFNSIVEGGVYPVAWKTADGVLLVKSDKKRSCDPSNHRPISACSHLEKLFQSILTRKLNEYLEEHGLLPRTQFGARAHHTCHQALALLIDVFEQAIEAGGDRPVYGASVDLAKAFDRCPRSVVLDSLRRVGVPEELVVLVEHMLEDRKIRFATGFGYTDDVGVKSGVVQGSSIGPLLYTLCTAALQEELERLPGVRVMRRGVNPESACDAAHTYDSVKEFLNAEPGRFDRGDKCSNDTTLSAVQFVDDTILIANSLTELQAAVDHLVERLTTCLGAALNEAKTVFFVVGAPDGDPHDRTLQVGTTLVHEIDADTKPQWHRVSTSGKETPIVEPRLVSLLEQRHRSNEGAERDNVPVTAGPTTPSMPASGAMRNEALEQWARWKQSKGDMPTIVAATGTKKAPQSTSKGIPMLPHLRTSTNKCRYRLHAPVGETPWVEVAGKVPQQQKLVRRLVPNPVPKAFRYLGVFLQTDLGWASQEQVLRDSVYPVLDRVAMIALSRPQVRTLIESNVMSKLTYVLAVASVSDDFITAMDKRIEGTVKAALRIRRSYANAIVHDPQHGAGVGRLRDAVDKVIIKGWAVHLEKEDESLTGAMSVMRARQVMTRLGVGESGLKGLTMWTPKAGTPSPEDSVVPTVSTPSVASFTQPTLRELDGPLWERSWAAGPYDMMGTIVCNEAPMRRSVVNCPSDLKYKLAQYQQHRSDKVKYVAQAGAYSRLWVPHNSVAKLPKRLRELLAPEGMFEIDINCCVFQAMAMEYSKWARDRPPPLVECLLEDKVSIRTTVSKEAGSNNNMRPADAKAQRNPPNASDGKEILRDAAGRLSPLCTGSRKLWHVPRTKRRLLAEVYNMVLGLIMKDFYGCMIKVKENVFKSMARVYRYVVMNLEARVDPALISRLDNMGRQPYAGATPFEEDDTHWNCPLEYALPEDVLPGLSKVARIIMKEEQCDIPHVCQPRGSGLDSCLGVADDFHRWFERWVPDRAVLPSTGLVGLCDCMTAARVRRLANEEARTLRIHRRGMGTTQVQQPAAAAGLAYFTSRHESRMLNICYQHAVAQGFEVVAYINDALLLKPGPKRVSPSWLQQVVRTDMRNHGYWGGVAVENIGGMTRNVTNDPSVEQTVPTVMLGAARNEKASKSVAGTTDNGKLTDAEPVAAEHERLGWLQRSTIPRTTNTRFESFLRALGRTGMRIDWKHGYCPLVEPRSTRPTLTEGRPWVMWTRAIPSACRSWHHLDELIDGRRLRPRSVLSVLHDPRDCAPPSDPLSYTERERIAEWGRRRPRPPWSECVQKGSMRRSPSMCAAVFRGMEAGKPQWQSPSRRPMTEDEYEALKSVVCSHLESSAQQQCPDQPEVDRDLWGLSGANMRQGAGDGQTTDFQVGDLVALHPQLTATANHEVAAFSWYGVVRATKAVSEEWCTWSTGMGEDVLTAAVSPGYMVDELGVQMVFVEQIVQCEDPPENLDEGDEFEQDAQEAAVIRLERKRQARVLDERNVEGDGGSSSSESSTDTQGSYSSSDREDVGQAPPEDRPERQETKEGVWKGLYQPWPFETSPEPEDTPISLGLGPANQYQARTLKEYRVGRGVGTTVKNRWLAVPVSELYPVTGHVARPGGVTTWEVYGGDMGAMRDASIIEGLPVAPPNREERMPRPHPTASDHKEGGGRRSPSCPQ